jgi:hypothetical protein
MSQQHGGKRPGAGRKSKAEENDLQGLMLRCWPKKQRMEMVRKWAERAERGDLEAGKLLMAYTYGKPTERHEHTGRDGGPIEHSIQGQIDKVYGSSE